MVVAGRSYAGSVCYFQNNQSRLTSLGRVVSLLMDVFEAHRSHYYLLRYNSRGVGKSSGWPSLTGLSEGEDLRALVQWAIGTIGNIKSLVIVV